MVRCGECGQENPPQAKFCLECGARLDARSRSKREVRRVVTIVFSDVTGSTKLGERLDPESLRRVMSSYFEEMRSALEDHGGTVEKFIGDAVMAVFGIPVLHEDDALRAVRAATDMRDRLAKLNEELRADLGVELQARTGVNTGEIVAGDGMAGQALVTGDAVNVAARLEQAAKPGQILLGEDTFKLVRNAVEVDESELLSLKGKELPIPAIPLRNVKQGIGLRRTRMTSPMLGRERERAHILQTFERAQQEDRCHLFTVLGSAGVGKSRLVDSVVTELGEHSTILMGRCLAYGKGNTFWPVQEVVKAAARMDDNEPLDQAQEKVAALVNGSENAGNVASLIEQAIGLAETTASIEEIFWGVRKLFESLASERPLVVVFDDIHWGEAAFLDLIEHVADWSRDVPILLLCVARPDLLDVRSTWGGGKLNAATILLEPLGDAVASELVDNLLGGADIDETARNKIVDAAEGNPLFVEEMISMMVDEGFLVESEGRWVPTGEISRLVIPPTIQALLAARLDLLEHEERVVIEAASVVGKVFYLGAVQELVDEAIRSDVPKHLMTLVRKELLRSERSTLGQDAFRFRHILIRDAAYASMPKEARADLHERFARWLLGTAGERLTEFEEIVGHHLEQAYRLHVELAPVNDGVRGLADEAVDMLLNVFERARIRDDMGAAATILERVIFLMSEDDARLPRTLRWLATVQQATGAFDDAARNTQRGLALASARGDRVEEGYLALQSVHMTTSGSTENWPELAKAEAERWLPFFEERDDASGLALAYSILSSVSLVKCRWMETLELANRSLDYARQTDDQAVRATMGHMAASGYFFGPVPAEEAIARLEDLENDVATTAALKITARASAAPLYAMLGDFATARAIAEEAEAFYSERGHGLTLACMGFMTGPIEQYAGDMDAAVRAFTRSHEELLALDEEGFRSTIDGWLALLLVRLGRYDEAEKYALESRRISPDGDISAHMSWRAAYAAVLAARGSFDEATELIGEAIEMVEGTDFLNEKAEIVLAESRVYELAGDLDRAVSSMQRAIELYSAKGNTSAVALTEPELQRLIERANLGVGH